MACSWLGFAGFCTSCCVPFFRRQAQDALHHGRLGPEGQLCSAEDSSSLSVSLSMRVAALVVDNGGLCMAGFACCDAHHVVFPLVLAQDPRYLDCCGPGGQLCWDAVDVDNSCTCMAGFAGDELQVVLCFLLLSRGP